MRGKSCAARCWCSSCCRRREFSRSCVTLSSIDWSADLCVVFARRCSWNSCGSSVVLRPSACIHSVCANMSRLANVKGRNFALTFPAHPMLALLRGVEGSSRGVEGSWGGGWHPVNNVRGGIPGMVAVVAPLANGHLVEKGEGGGGKGESRPRADVSVGREGRVSTRDGVVAASRGHGWTAIGNTWGRAQVGERGWEGRHREVAHRAQDSGTTKTAP